MKPGAILGALLCALCSNLVTAAGAPKPDIVLILAGDFGCECVTANGGQSYQTPNLARLAATGMRFEQCHAQPLCTPTRAQLIEYDPDLATLCREVFGDTQLKYTKPATRLTGHMAGYDPATAPTFVWPERLARAKAEIRAKAQARDKAASSDGPHDSQIDP